MQFLKKIRDHDLASTETITFDGTFSFNDIFIDYGADGTIDRREYHISESFSDGLMVGTHTAYDLDGDEYIDLNEYTNRTWDTSGRLLTVDQCTSDLDNDNQVDYRSLLTYTYDSSGLLTQAETLYFFNGVQSTADYRLETFTYTAAGLPDVETVDDWAFYDFVVGKDSDYDSLDRITSVSRMDEFVYGDEGYHVTETWSYAPDGSVTYSNVTGQTEWGFFASLTTKLTYDTATKTSELIEGKDANGDVVFRAKEEIWRNYFGEETDILTSYDGNLDGSFTPGSKSNYMDSRDRTKMKYADIFGDSDRELVFHTVDIGLDKVIDYQMEITPIDTILA